MKKFNKNKQSGIALIEFVLVAPIFAFAYASLVVVTDYYFVVKNVDRVTNFLAEFVSTQQQFGLEDGVIVDNLAQSALLPYTKTIDATVVVASLGNDGSNVYTVWCYFTSSASVLITPNCSGTDTASLNNFSALSGAVEIVVSLQYTPLGVSKVPIFVESRKVRPLRESDLLPYVAAASGAGG